LRPETTPLSTPTPARFCNNKPMSALGQKRTSDWRPLMSAIHTKADIPQHRFDVRFVPIADIREMTCVKQKGRLARGGPGLVAHVDGRRQFHRIVRQWVLGVLQVGDHVVRGSAREAFDVRILDDRLVELRERYVDQRKAPASAVHLQMAGSVYCVSPNRWPTWPRVNIQVASLVN
jgi:hypothetical protein